MTLDDVQREQAKAARRETNERARAGHLADLADLSRQARSKREQIAVLDDAVAET